MLPLLVAIWTEFGTFFHEGTLLVNKTHLNRCGVACPGVTLIVDKLWEVCSSGQMSCDVCVVGTCLERLSCFLERWHINSCRQWVSCGESGQPIMVPTQRSLHWLNVCLHHSLICEYLCTCLQYTDNFLLFWWFSVVYFRWRTITLVVIIKCVNALYCNVSACTMYTFHEV